MLAASLATAAKSLKEASPGYIEKLLRQVALQATLVHLFMKIFQRGIHAPKFMYAFTQKIFNYSLFTNPLATFFKQRMNDTVDK